MLHERLQCDGRIEPVREDEQAVPDEGDTRIEHGAGDVEQGSDGEHDVPVDDAGALTEVECGGQHVRVGVERALRWAGGPGGVGEQREVVPAEFDQGRPPAAKAREEFDEVAVGRRRGARGGLEHPRIVAGLEIEGAGADRESHAAASQGLRRGRGAHVFAEDADRLRIVDEAAEFVSAVHRIEHQRCCADLPQRQQSEDVLRHILQVDAHPVTAPDAPLAQRDGEGVRQVVDLTGREDAIEIGHGRVIGMRLHARLPRVERGRHGWLLDSVVDERRRHRMSFLRLGPNGMSEFERPTDHSLGRCGQVLCVTRGVSSRPRPPPGDRRGSVDGRSDGCHSYFRLAI